MPTHLLRERGLTPVIFYSNSNIAPRDEYEHRLQTLHTWAEEQGIEVVEDEYDNALWQEAVAGHTSKEERCRACYRMRFEAAARYAHDAGFTRIGTTLSVSPYQFTDIIHEELERAAQAHGPTAQFEDYRPYYDEATRISRGAGMYRQNYCGCLPSAAEAASERQERKRQRAAEKAARREANAALYAEEEQARQTKRAERARYDEKQRRKHAVLKSWRDQQRAQERAQDEALQPEARLTHAAPAVSLRQNASNS